MKLFYNPQSRAATARWMLEEVGADYELIHVEIPEDDNRDPRLTQVNPMGKIPTLILRDGTVLTEAAAICAYLADHFPQAELAPSVNSSKRGTYYRWLFFGGSAFEPALIETMMRKDDKPLPRAMVGWGTYDEVIDTLEGELSDRDYLVDDKFSAADVYLGSLLGWATGFGAPRLKESKPISDYVARLMARDAFKRAMAETVGTER